MSELDDNALQELIAFACGLADAAGAAILPFFRAGIAVENKRTEAFDPVTEADRQAERVIRQQIEKTYPTHRIQGEEFGAGGGKSDLCWYIDPIDGTRAFVTGSPMWGVLIGLHDGRAPVLGIMDQPFTGERFIGSRFGAYLWHKGGTQQLQTRACADLAQAVVTTTHPDLFGTTAERDAYLAVADQCMLNRYGGDCYAYAMLAHGLTDLVIESGLNSYDIQALIPIVTAAGGIVTAWDGGPADQGGRIIAAGDSRVHAQACQMLCDRLARTEC